MATNSTPDHEIAVGNVPRSQKLPPNGVGSRPQVKSTSDEIEVKCGPLLNYKHMSDENGPNPTWHGSVLIVTTPGQPTPTLSLRCLGPVGEARPNGTSTGAKNETRQFKGEKLYEDIALGFWRLQIECPVQPFEAKWEYHIPKLRHVETGSADADVTTKTFYVQSVTQSMRIMFHSCNGFSVGTDPEIWPGPDLWKEVMRQHEKLPIHVMIGGGDQIYNDGIRVTGPLRPWTDISNPVKRRDFPFPHELRSKCDEWYAHNYVTWYNTEPFSLANGQIAQLNIWDDHDIIDGFGSYTDHFMKCAIFRGIGGVALKYYLLFQHHVPPPKSTFTTDVKGRPGLHRVATDAEQLDHSYVMTETKEDPSFILGPKPGPYVEEVSRSIYTRLGARIAFFGFDARTERTRHQINYPETYDKVFNHVSQKLAEANGAVKHLILLLGVPIAYPRLQWLENLLSSPLIGPIRLLNKRFGVAGGLFNKFDGGVDLLDDLDDHYTAHQHKKERKQLVLRLQKLSQRFSVRITILGGDVHLAAFGRFYSKPSLGIAAENDFRFIPNIVSSAITNKPPPAAVANLLARRNKIHHLDHDTDETLLNIFDKDPSEGESEVAKAIATITANANHCTMPSRNFALITESSEHHPGGGSNGNAALNGMATHEGTLKDRQAMMAHHNRSRKTDNPRDAMHGGEDNCGVSHPAADGSTRTGLGGSYGLDVCYRVEIDPRNRDAPTQGYGLSIPALDVIASVDGDAKDEKVSRGVDKIMEAVQAHA